ncbi:MAG: protein-L-isoaspartate(D-aspartate) O-methyltransferase [Candidatus Eisenbacteria bacterium]|uniref:Protein-L-isoaspartate O-methyltransferase n=1 Tax=Eiseniibacteriota bacterium TaxID=2212470 RepID=A0A538U7Y1_UNCEI|nr:MAG: protein-L-isoaspartate(D-aspartate) O-methyltransferase [Candidatus Eisenbacteria bacterium]
MTPQSPPDFSVARRRMIEEQLIARGIRDQRVLEAMAAVPRDRFVDASLWPRAYGDHALPTIEGQTISQPWIVARMLELAELDPAQRVLEVGTGSGYQTALLARLTERVFSVERVASLLRAARARLDELGISNVALRHGDGSLGWQEFSPYARVVVTAAAPRVPRALLDQLDERGVLVIPVGGPRLQHLEVWRRAANGRWEHVRHSECRFVPLVGRDAWPEGENPPEAPHE